MRTHSSLVAGLALAALVLGGCGPSAPDGAAPAASTSGASGGGSVSTSQPGNETSATASPSAATPATTSATSGNTAPPAAPAALLSPGASGDRVRELQSRLEQLEWYDGDVTGTYGATTTAAVRGFQDKREMPATGIVDQATWERLVALTRRPSDDEIHNRLTPGPALLKPGSTGAQVKDLQARLKQIGWWSGAVTDSYGPQTAAAVKSFQGKRAIPVTGDVDQRTLDRLRAMTHAPSADELENTQPKPPTGTTAGLDARCLTGHAICISKATRSLTWVVDGQAQLHVAVRFGSENNPTREGSFTVYRKNRDWTSTLYGSKMPYSMFFSGGEAVHYSADFAARGYSGASHGCVNVRDLNGVAWLFDQAQIGDKVVVY